MKPSLVLLDRQYVELQQYKFAEPSPRPPSRNLLRRNLVMRGVYGYYLTDKGAAALAAHLGVGSPAGDLAVVREKLVLGMSWAIAEGAPFDDELDIALAALDRLAALYENTP